MLWHVDFADLVVQLQNRCHLPFCNPESCRASGDLQRCDTRHKEGRASDLADAEI